MQFLSRVIKKMASSGSRSFASKYIGSNRVSNDTVAVPGRSDWQSAYLWVCIALLYVTLAAVSALVTPNAYAERIEYNIERILSENVYQIGRDGDDMYYLVSCDSELRKFMAVQQSTGQICFSQQGVPGQKCHNAVARDDAGVIQQAKYACLK